VRFKRGTFSRAAMREMVCRYLHPHSYGEAPKHKVVSWGLYECRGQRTSSFGEAMKAGQLSHAKC
jgi:hypothetical protein